MLLSLSATLLALIVSWLGFASLVSYEERKGGRVVLVGLRSRLDQLVLWVLAVGSAFIRYVDRHIIRLSWYYSLHSLLQAALKVVVSLYDYLEQWFHQNRKRARALRAERRAVKRGVVPTTTASALLTSIAAHKENTALTERQKQKLKSKKLERE